MNNGLFSSNKDDWEIPQSFFESLNKQYKFDLDVAANSLNHKTEKYYSEQENRLNRDWAGRVFCNPPYGKNIKLWIKKAYEESKKNHCEIIVMLIPARTDTSYWHDYIFGKAEITFLRGRLKFENMGIAGGSAPFPSAVITYRGENE